MTYAMWCRQRQHVITHLDKCHGQRCTEDLGHGDQQWDAWHGRQGQLLIQLSTGSSTAAAASAASNYLCTGTSAHVSTSIAASPAAHGRPCITITESAAATAATAAMPLVLKMMPGKVARAPARMIR